MTSFRLTRAAVVALGAFAAFVAQHGESGDGNSSTIEGNSDGATADSA